MFSKFHPLQFNCYFIHADHCLLFHYYINNADNIPIGGSRSGLTKKDKFFQGIKNKNKDMIKCNTLICKNILFGVLLITNQVFSYGYADFPCVGQVADSWGNLTGCFKSDSPAGNGAWVLGRSS